MIKGQNWCFKAISDQTHTVEHHWAYLYIYKKEYIYIYIFFLWRTKMIELGAHLFQSVGNVKNQEFRVSYIAKSRTICSSWDFISTKPKEKKNFENMHDRNEWYSKLWMVHAVDIYWPLKNVLYYTQMTNMTEITESEMRMRYECANHRRKRIQHEEIFTKEIKVKHRRPTFCLPFCKSWKWGNNLNIYKDSLLCSFGEIIGIWNLSWESNVISNMYCKS